MKPKILAHYLPQFYPIKENNEWFGEGFTEWTNVGKTRPLFKGHDQPRVPADLGYYDLRLPEVRKAQAQLAREAGVDAFLYYHYWFGNGKVLLDMPLKQVIKLGEPDFPFCVCWANHDWQRKNWDAKAGILNKEMLMPQKYPGKQDIIDHFYFLLPAFKDQRYYKIHDRLVFVVYSPEEVPNVQEMMDIWNNLAKKEGLPGFYYIGYSYHEGSLGKAPYTSFDANALCLLHKPISFASTSSRVGIFQRRVKTVLAEFLKRPMDLYNYQDVYHHFISEKFKEDKVYPVIVPNWDVTPRRGAGAYILHKAKPEYFQSFAENVFEIIKNKDDEDKVVLLKSWNEWGEGNYMEPDLTYGKGYIKALNSALKKYQ